MLNLGTLISNDTLRTSVTTYLATRQRKHISKRKARSSPMEKTSGVTVVHFPIWFLLLQFLTNIFKGNEIPASAPGRQVFKIKLE